MRGLDPTRQTPAMAHQAESTNADLLKVDRIEFAVVPSQDSGDNVITGDRRRKLVLQKESVDGD